MTDAGIGANDAMVEPPHWENLEFRHYPTDAIFRVLGDREADPPWEVGQTLPATDPLCLPVTAAVLSYGCGVIEGLKARRCADGRVLLFRPGDHGSRFARSAERLLMLPFPPQRFVEVVDAVVRANLRFVPPTGRGAFYLRPMQHGIDEMLGLARGRRFAVTVYGSPVGELSDMGDRSAGLRLKVLPICRAAPGGTGGAKAIGNYPGTLLHKQQAQAEGFNDVLYLDASGQRLLQETGGSNVLCRMRSGTLVTPASSDTILEGITRDSALQVAGAWGVPVEQRPLPLEEVLDDAVECFCAGTAWSVRSVTELSVEGRVHRFDDTSLAKRIRDELRGVQCGEREDRFGWTHAVALDARA